MLCKDIPSEFSSFLKYARSLRFFDKPDYSYLRLVFFFSFFFFFFSFFFFFLSFSFSFFLTFSSLFFFFPFLNSAEKCSEISSLEKDFNLTACMIGVFQMKVCLFLKGERGEEI